MCYNINYFKGDFMIFYRLMSKEEYQNKKIHNNEKNFDDMINTHKYKKGKNYIHLFLNAESCFESFDKISYDKCLIGKFDIPDEIVCKYGIGLGGYDFLCNDYNMNYRYLDYKNINGNYCFWLPEIAILEDDFNYDWCIKTSQAGKKNRGLLPFEFETDLVSYREIINDGYLYGYSNKDELLKKYKNMIKTKLKIINILKTTKSINVGPKSLNKDSLTAVNILIDYALKNKLIKNKDEIKITIKTKVIEKAINLTDSSYDNGNYVIINKNYNHTNPSFCAMLDNLGINVDKSILYTITKEENTVIDYSLTKKLEAF